MLDPENDPREEKRVEEPPQRHMDEGEPVPTPPMPSTVVEETRRTETTAPPTSTKE